MTSSSTGFLWTMSTVPTSDHLKEKFMALYSTDFDITGGDLMQFVHQSELWRRTNHCVNRIVSFPTQLVFKLKKRT